MSIIFLLQLPFEHYFELLKYFFLLLVVCGGLNSNDISIEMSVHCTLPNALCLTNQ